MKKKKPWEIKRDSKTKIEFFLLGMTIDWTTHPMSAKGKPIYLKSRSKGTMDIAVRNLKGFSRFLELRKIQGQRRLHATSHDENSVYKPKCMIVVLVLWGCG